MSSTSNCEYHPDRIAVTKCERCNRLICVNDKTIYRKRVSSGTGNHRHSTTYTYEYCPVCYSDQKINDATGAGTIAVSIFFIIFGFFWISLTANAFPPFILVGLGLIGIGIYNILTGPQKAQAARDEQDRFLQSLSTSPKGVSQKTVRKNPVRSRLIRPKWSNTQLSCFQCGNSLTLTDDYCMNCGDSTKDEREDLEV